MGPPEMQPVVVSKCSTTVKGNPFYALSSFHNTLRRHPENYK